MAKRITINEFQLDTLKLACAKACNHIDDLEVIDSIAATLGDITLQFELQP